MHPLDTADRIPEVRTSTASDSATSPRCTKVCPEHITITDNAIIPLKERVVDEFYDPIQKLIRLVVPRKKD